MNMRERIQQALLALTPTHLEVHDESHMHSRGLETHYKVVIVSEHFDGLALLRRHQTVHTALGELMTQFHALALHTYSPSEWIKHADAPDSPRCRGGSKHEQRL